MDLKTSKRFDKRAILGIVFLFIGVLFLTENLGWLSFNLQDVIFSLPALAIFIGIVTITRRGNNAFGYILVIVGTLFLTLRILNIPYDFHRIFWPFVLVTIGLTILFQNKRQSHHSWKNREHWADSEKWKKHEHWYEKPESSSDIIDEVNVFGGCERRITSKSFKGGKVTSIFGGATYDMRDCELADGKNVVDIVNIFGGTKLIIPAHWKVHVEVVSIFGGFADKRTNVIVDDSGTRELHFVGVVIFGGGEIKSF